MWGIFFCAPGRIDDLSEPAVNVAVQMTSTLPLKLCNDCKLEKDHSLFNKNATKRDGLQSMCRDCTSIRNADTYRRLPQRREAIRRRNRINYDIARKHVFDYLVEHPCVDCGESDPVVLEFDHIGDDKLCEVSSLVRGATSVTRVQAEIDKCEVRCANCHRRVTAKRAGHWRYLATSE